VRKIPTVFERDAESRKVVPRLTVRPDDLFGAFATEKLDGTNVRVTVRSGGWVRLEARKNPGRQQKAEGVVEPWYRDAAHSEDEAQAYVAPADKHVVAAVNATDFSGVADGEWAGEAIGPKVQGNPLGLEVPRVVLFSSPAVRDTLRYPPFPLLVPTREESWFAELREWLEAAESLVAPGRKPEGLVFWRGSRAVAKIKRKDF
jgi:hypothetical protein